MRPFRPAPLLLLTLAATGGEDGYEDARRAMVDGVRRRGVKAETVLAALGTVPRHRFVPARFRHRAYEDRALAIGHDQTIPQPFLVARMIAALRVGKRTNVLEVGTRSAYPTAVLAAMTRTVRTVEGDAAMAERAGCLLDALGYGHVRRRRADPRAGWKEGAPYHAILVTAAVPRVPPALLAQLGNGGRMVVPVGPAYGKQDLRLVERDKAGRVSSRRLCGVRFVPLVSARPSASAPGSRPR